MGQATRNIANSFTTSGVITSSAVNNTTISGITDLSLGGSLILISESTASASSSISFTSGIDSTYDEYWFIFNNCHPSNIGPNFDFFASTNGGSSYSTTVTSTFFAASHNEAGSSTSLGYDTGNDEAQTTDGPTIGGSGYANDESNSGILKLYNPSSTTYVKHFISRMAIIHGSYTNQSNQTFSAGYFNTTSAIDAVKFQFSAGNIDDGTIQMFGVK